LLKDSEMFPINHLSEIFPFGYNYLNTILNKWFGHSISQLRQLIKAGCLDWRSINTFNNEQLKVFRGKSSNEIKELLLKSKRPLFDLSKAFGLIEIHTFAMYKISQFFTGQDMYATELQRFLRKEEAIRLLREGVDPHTILEEYFDLRIWRTRGGGTYLDKSRLRFYYEQYMFRGCGLTFEQIVEAYHNNPGRILGLYTKGNILLKD